MSGLQRVQGHLSSTVLVLYSLPAALTRQTMSPLRVGPSNLRCIGVFRAVFRAPKQLAHVSPRHANKVM